MLAHYLIRLANLLGLPKGMAGNGTGGRDRARFCPREEGGVPMDPDNRRRVWTGTKTLACSATAAGFLADLSMPRGGEPTSQLKN